MPTIDGASPINPDEAPRESLQRVPRITLVIHGSPTGQLPPEPASPVLAPVPASAAVVGPLPRQPRGGRHEFVDPTWFGRLERLLQSWPITLRLALLVVIVLTGTAAVAAAIGIGGQLALAVLSLRARRAQSRNVTALRRREGTSDTAV